MASHDLNAVHSSLSAPQNEPFDLPESAQAQFGAWAFGILLVFGGLSSTIPLIGLIWIGMGLILLPPAAARIESWTHWELTPERRRHLLIGGLALTILIAAVLVGVEMSDHQHMDQLWQKWIDRVGAIGS